MVEQHILARIYEHCASGKSDEAFLVELVTEFDGDANSINENPEPFLKYLHDECDFLDWFSIMLVIQELCGRQLPRAFDERLEAATTLEKFDQVVGPYLEPEHEHQEREDHEHGDTDDCA